MCHLFDQHHISVCALSLISYQKLMTQVRRVRLTSGTAQPRSPDELEYVPELQLVQDEAPAASRTSNLVHKLPFIHKHSCSNVRAQLLMTAVWLACTLCSSALT